MSVLTDVRCTVRVIVKDLAKEGALDEERGRPLKTQKPPDVYGHITYSLWFELPGQDGL